ncbi:hypothetical protein L5515_001207 [Caenorhabditis briggsae]|uniref:Uncharacterized protein n=1 Tax=Caenorhabditis briggsae TaxID=6238 RepID=A0AAE9E273_CAEBR|nr:hypothetical protein L5515_001207 [Caenorhabditis briggsae]
MLLSGSMVRALIATAYILTISTSSALTFFFYSEPVLFAFVITAVSLLVLSYPILCIITVSHSYDLQVKGCCQFEWIPMATDLIETSVKSLEEKPSKLDEAFAYAYMAPWNATAVTSRNPKTTEFVVHCTKMEK